MTAIDFNLVTKCGGEPKAFKSGETIFREGDPADCLYVVLHGQVDITLGNRLLKPFGEGEIFGEIALIDGAPRSASAVARSDVTLIPVNEAVRVSGRPVAVFRARRDARAGRAAAGDEPGAVARRRKGAGFAARRCAAWTRSPYNRSSV